MQQRVLPQTDETMQASTATPSDHKISPNPGEVASAPSVFTSDPPTSNPPARSGPTSSSKPVSSERPYRSGQPSVKALAKLGIKVRDYGYGNPLPPVAGYWPQQLQPDPERPYKHPRGEENDADSSQSQGDPKKAKMERTLTEPVIEDTSSETRGFLVRRYENLNAYNLRQESDFFGSQPPRYSTPSNSQPPPQRFESQASEPYVHTPLVTPNGSLQWNVTDTNDVPASQLDSAPQAVAAEPVSYSQLGFSQVEDSEPSQRDMTPAASSPLTEPPSSLIFPPRARASPSPVAGPSAQRPDAASPSVISHKPHTSHPATSPTPVSPYQAHERSAHESPENGRVSSLRSQTLSRPPAFSKQSMHSQKRTASGASPSTRNLRKRSDKRVVT